MHKAFLSDGVKGVRMGNAHCEDRMVIAVSCRDDLRIDVQEAFRLRNYNQDLVTNADGTFHHPNTVTDGNDYGAAISVTLTLAPKSSVSFPLVKVLDFPSQHYSDNTGIPRKLAAQDGSYTGEYLIIYPAVSGL
jgi:hypothetical protein